MQWKSFCAKFCTVAGLCTFLESQSYFWLWATHTCMCMNGPRQTFIHTIQEAAAIFILPLTTWPPSPFHHIARPPCRVRSRCKSQLSQITQRYSHLFSFPLNTTPGKNLRVGGAILDPYRMPLSTCLCVSVCVLQEQRCCIRVTL